MKGLARHRGRSKMWCPHRDRDRVRFHDESEHCLTCGEVVNLGARRSAGHRVVGSAAQLLEAAVVLAVLAAGGLVLFYLLVKTTAMMMGHWPFGV